MSFKQQLIENLKDCLLLLVKWGLLIAAIIYAFNFSLQTRQMAINGEQAAVMILELQKKGYLPKVENGQIPDKPKVEEVKK